VLVLLLVLLVLCGGYFSVMLDHNDECMQCIDDFIFMSFLYISVSSFGFYDMCLYGVAVASPYLHYCSLVINLGFVTTRVPLIVKSLNQCVCP